MTHPTTKDHADLPSPDSPCLNKQMETMRTRTEMMIKTWWCTRGCCIVEVKVQKYHPRNTLFQNEWMQQLYHRVRVHAMPNNILCLQSPICFTSGAYISVHIENGWWPVVLINMISEAFSRWYSCLIFSSPTPGITLFMRSSPTFSIPSDAHTRLMGEPVRCSSF